jgi:hypothetical protein
MNRATIVAQIKATQQTLKRLLALLESSEQDRFASRVYHSRRDYRQACDSAGKSGKQIERSLIATFRFAESLGFKGAFRQWEHVMRIGD